MNNFLTGIPHCEKCNTKHYPAQPCLHKDDNTGVINKFYLPILHEHERMTMPEHAIEMALALHRFLSSDVVRDSDIRATSEYDGISHAWKAFLKDYPDVVDIH